MLDLFYRNHDAFQKIAGIDQKILCFEKELTKKRRDLREKETAFSSKQREYDAALKEARKLNASMEHGERRPLPEVIALLNELERARDEHGRKDDRAKLTRLLQEKQTKISELERKIRTALDFSEEAYDEGERRKICLDIFRESISRNMVKIFNAEIFKQDMAGNLIFNSGKEALKIRIGNNGGDVKELHQLSGGERSKTLVSLIISFWVHMSPPFRCLDEWDVFLDEKSRSATEKVLVQHALSSPYQFIFISPQTSNVEGVHKIRIGE